MSGYADLSGVDCNNVDIKKFNPFINFKWSDNLNFQNNNELCNLYSTNVILKRSDLISENSQFNIMCYNGEIKNTKMLTDVYNAGFRVIRLNNDIKISKTNIKNINSSKLIIDTYNMSDRNFRKLVKYTTKPIFLSIGNSTAVSTNKKNASDAKIKAVKTLNGVVGVNISKDHLTTNVGRYDSFEYIFRHIDYLIDLIGIDNLCFSAGFDNNNVLPWEVSKLGDVKVVENWLKVFYGNEAVEKIMWKNVYNFLEKNLE